MELQQVSKVFMEYRQNGEQSISKRRKLNNKRVRGKEILDVVEGEQGKA